MSRTASRDRGGAEPRAAGLAAGRRCTRRQALRAASAGGAIGALAAAGCSGSGAPSGPRSTLATPTTLVWLNWANTAPVREANAKTIELFQSKYPQLKVEDAGVTTDVYWEKFASLLAAGTPPDLYEWEPKHVLEHVSRKWPLDLLPYIRRDRFDLADFPSRGVDQYRYKGGLWGLPLGFANQEMLYNVTAYKRAGLPLPSIDLKKLDWTWDTFLLAAKRLHNPEAGMWAFTMPRDFRRWAVWVWNNGGEIIDEQRLICLLDQPPAVEALQFLQDLLIRHQVWPDPLPQGASFESGQIMMRGGVTPGEPGNLRRVIGTSFEWGVVMHPLGKGGKGYAAAGGGAGWAIHRQTKHADASWAFLQVLTSGEVDVINCQVQGGGTGSRRKSSNAHPACALIEPPIGMKLFADAADIVRSDPRIPGWAEVDAIWTAQLRDLWSGKSPARQVAAEIKRLVEPAMRDAARQLGL
jgi:multiple sugar transport system substrate-binding protein